MKAIIRTGYGSPDVLQLKELEKPTPGEGEVLVKIQAAAVNPADYHRLRSRLAHFVGWLLRVPDYPGLGIDVAGRVEAVGVNVTQFQPGDEVFGGCAGSFAEYTSARENRLALKPGNISFDAAAAVPVAALTALQGLRDTGKITSGQSVLVNGASGGVGTFAVQIAKSYGTEVTGVCRTRNLEMVRSIGADHVIDYTREDFTRNGQRYDLIYDAVGNHSISDYQRALQPNGTCVVAGFKGLPRLFEYLVLGPLRSKTGNKKVGLMGIAKINRQDLVVLQELLEAGKVVSVIDRRYPLSKTAEAIRYLEEGHAKGKVVILM
jgi:NADPH:quinone reductase-like Zn-dependent oxidoreductase